MWIKLQREFSIGTRRINDLFRKTQTEREREFIPKINHVSEIKSAVRFKIASPQSMFISSAVILPNNKKYIGLCI